MIQLQNIQSLVFHGYGKKNRAFYAFLKFDQARRHDNVTWLHLQRQFVSASDTESKKQDTDIDGYRLAVAFTYQGLGFFNLQSESNNFIQNYSYAFRCGMNKRSEILNDNPSNWIWGGVEKTVPDILVIMFAKEENFYSETEKFSKGYLAAGLQEVHTEVGYINPDETEHFGFKDGISQPFIEGYHDTTQLSNLCKAGEFLLGYCNERGVYPNSPALKEVSNEGKPNLPIDTDTNGYSLGDDGTYLVVRQLEQNVEQFNADNKTELDAAKLIGRWRSGAPLTLSPDVDDKSLSDSNEFGYYDLDRYGSRCPLGSHVRRSNPRDSLSHLDEIEDPDKVRKMVNRHRIIRRARLYDRTKKCDQVQGNDDKIKQGLMFVCVNASIETQFEFILQNWLNRSDFNSLHDEVDPIASIGDNNEMPVKCKFTEQKPPGKNVRSISQYVKTIGGAYFFLPSIKALQFIINRPASKPSAL